MKFKSMPYERIHFEEIEKKYLELIERFKNATSGEEQFNIHERYYELNDQISTTMTIAKIRHDVDTSDDFYNMEKEYYDKIQPQISNLMTEYQQEMFHSPFRTFLEEKIGKVAFKNIELQIKSFDEKLIDLMQEENALTTRYNKLIAGAKIDWEGKTLNLSMLVPYLTNSNRDIRKNAYTKYSAFFTSIENEIDDIFDKLIKNRTKQAEKMGYSNFVELGYYRMNRNCYDKDMVKKYRQQVKDYFVPFAEKLHERRKKRLKLSKLSYIDTGVYFLNGNPTPIGTPSEIMAAGQQMYSELSPETKEFFDFMMEHELFDIIGRNLKNSGGYMTYLPKYNAPFIFANFNGTSGDVDVITHECGHAFQGYLSGQDKIQEHRDITMETAEIHSMAMEFFTEKWSSLFFGERSDDYLNMHIESAAMFIPYGCMVDEFQHIVYENPNMTPKERHQMWLMLEKEYRPHMDYEDDIFFSKGGFWQKQLHIYNYPFYYIDYCLAQTCAFQYKVKMDENYQEAWNSYLKLCKLSARDFYTNLLKQVDLESPFDDSCIRNIIEKLESKI